MENSNMKFCKFCGEKIPYDAVLCTHCGRQVEKMQQENAAVQDLQRIFSLLLLRSAKQNKMVLSVVAAVNAAPNTDIVCIQFWKHCGDHKHRKLHAIRILFFCQLEIETVFISLLQFGNIVEDLMDKIPAVAFPYS
ncbi:MAG: hypothetical protein IKW00_02495, partial [Clostridia bacterium]|nr:hypothetical protein [Clostridia bacterium]